MLVIALVLTGWLLLSVLAVALCRMAALGDADPAESPLPAHSPAVSCGGEGRQHAVASLPATLAH